MDVLRIRVKKCKDERLNKILEEEKERLDLKDKVIELYLFHLAPEVLEKESKVISGTARKVGDNDYLVLIADNFIGNGDYFRRSCRHELFHIKEGHADKNPMRNTFFNRILHRIEELGARLYEECWKDYKK